MCFAIIIYRLFPSPLLPFLLTKDFLFLLPLGQEKLIKYRSKKCDKKWGGRGGRRGFYEAVAPTSFICRPPCSFPIFFSLKRTARGVINDEDGMIIAWYQAYLRPTTCRFSSFEEEEFFVTLKKCFFSQKNFQNILWPPPTHPWGEKVSCYLTSSFWRVLVDCLSSIKKKILTNSSRNLSFFLPPSILPFCCPLAPHNNWPQFERKEQRKHIFFSFLWWEEIRQRTQQIFSPIFPPGSFYLRFRKERDRNKSFFFQEKNLDDKKVGNISIFLGGEGNGHTWAPGQSSEVRFPILGGKDNKGIG